MIGELWNIVSKKYNDFFGSMTFYNHLNRQLLRNPLIALRFFTIWALLLHVLFRIGIFPYNTFATGTFVLIGSIILFWIYPGYYRYLYGLEESDPSSPYYELAQHKFRYIGLLVIIDICTHYLPLFLIAKVPESNIEWYVSFAVLFISIALYITIIGMEYVWNMYYYLLDPVRSPYIEK